LSYGFGIIGLVDNLFRFILNKRLGNIHPLITVFGVIAGIGMFGFIGLIFGPMLLSLFIVLLKVYSNEFLSKKRESKRANTRKMRLNNNRIFPSFVRELIRIYSKKISKHTQFVVFLSLNNILVLFSF
jgi:Predicted permease